MGVSRPLLVAMCGLPGSGKSTISRALAERLGAARWDKDELRHLLFPPALANHGRELNDACMELLYAALPAAFARVPIVVLDGRPYAIRAHRERARRAALDAGADILFLLCTAPAPVLRQRLTTGAHLAPDRDVALLDRLAAEWEPFDGDVVVVDTGGTQVAQGVEACLSEVHSRRAG